MKFALGRVIFTQAIISDNEVLLIWRIKPEVVPAITVAGETIPEHELACAFANFIGKKFTKSETKIIHTKAFLSRPSILQFYYKKPAW